MHAKHLVLYDDECPLCKFQMRMLTWLDWFGVLSLVALSRPEAAEVAREKGLNAEQLSAAIHCVARNGRVYRGARALRFVGMRLPLLVPIALVLWVPGVIWVAEMVYRWVSRHRMGLSRLFGCKGACKLLPAREREQDRVG